MIRDEYIIKAVQAKVWVTSSSHAKIQTACTMGASGGFDYREEDWHLTAAEMMGHPDLIIDSAGGKGYSQLLELLRPGGSIINYGATAGPPKVDLFKVFWKQLRIQGSTMGSPKDFQAMLDFITQHQIHPTVDEVIPLEEGNQALERMHVSNQFGKLVLKINGES